MRVDGYAIDGMLFYYASGGNTAGGIKLDLNGGSATINNIFWTTIAGTGVANTANNANTNTAGGLASTQQSYLTGSTVASAPNFILIKGFVQINTAGSFIPRWAQAVSGANATNRTANSYLSLMKIG